jgi:hypothetical protein
LLQRAGFALPVTDVDAFTVRYAHPLGLMRDLRAMGATNVLAERSRKPLSQEAVAAARAAFAAQGNDGRTTEVFEILHFAAWTPA